MHAKMNRLGERLWTQRTCERPLSSMYPHVFTKFEGPCTPFPAYRALVRRVGCVHLTLVFFKDPSLLESAAAHRTHVRTLGAVGHVMPFERSHRAEGGSTLLATGCLLPTVGCAVLLHLALVEKRFPASITRKTRIHCPVLL